MMREFKDLLGRVADDLGVTLVISPRYYADDTLDFSVGVALEYRLEQEGKKREIKHGTSDMQIIRNLNCSFHMSEEDLKEYITNVLGEALAELSEGLAALQQRFSIPSTAS